MVFHGNKNSILCLFDATKKKFSVKPMVEIQWRHNVDGGDRSMPRTIRFRNV